MPLLLINDVPVDCINQAAITYHVPAKLILSVLKAEGGRNGLASRNQNGSYDYGPMQINTSWLKDLKRYGYSANDLQFNPCKNVKVGAWILSKNMGNNSILWNGVGNYHSHDKNRNNNYAKQVIREYRLIDKKLGASV